MAVAVGMLGTLSASAFGTWNNATYASRYRRDAQPAACGQAKPEVQVAVMATATAQSTANKPSTNNQGAQNANMWGQRNWCATHSH